MLFTPLPVTSAGTVAGVTSGTANGTNCGQRYVGSSPLVETTTTATSDVWISGFRYSATGALRARDCTGGLPATTNVGYNGIRLDTNGRACFTQVSKAFTGTNYLWNDGVNANYVSVPDSAALSVTGDIDIRVDCALDDYTPSAINAFVSKDNNTGAAASRAYQFYISTLGQLEADFSTDGSTVLNVVASTSTGVTDGTRATLRVTRIASTGDVNFYKGTSVSDTSWTQIGTTQSTSAGALFDNALDLFIAGARAAGTNTLNGKLYRVQIRSGSSGTIVLDADFTAVAEGATSFTESSSNAATVTINSTGAKPAYIYSPKIVAGMAISGDGRFFMTVV